MLFCSANSRYSPIKSNIAVQSSGMISFVSTGICCFQWVLMNY
jgi:hypothetical protein